LSKSIANAYFEEILWAPVCGKSAQPIGMVKNNLKEGRCVCEEGGNFYRREGGYYSISVGVGRG